MKAEEAGDPERTGPELDNMFFNPVLGPVTVACDT